MCYSGPSDYLVIVSRCQPHSSLPHNIILAPPNVRFSIKKIEDLLFLLPTSVFIFKLLLRLNPSVVVSHMTLNSSLVLFISLLLRVKRRIYFNHGFSFLGYNGIRRLVLYLFEFVNIMFSSTVISVSPTQANLVRSQNLLLNHKKIFNTFPGSCAGLSSDCYMPLQLLKKD